MMQPDHADPAALNAAGFAFIVTSIPAPGRLPDWRDDGGGWYWGRRWD